MTFASMVSCDIVCIAFLISALYDLDILAGDIQNTYLNAPAKNKKLYSDDEWKSDQGNIVLIVRYFMV